MKDIAEITCRHHAELATTWWRRENSPLLLLRGQPQTFLELDSKMEAYMDGAGLNTRTMFEHLCANQNQAAPDFIADIVAAFLATSVGGVDQGVADAWLQSVNAHPQFIPALSAAKRWLGRTGVMPSDKDELNVKLWHPAEHLRFIDGMGRVRAHYQPDLQLSANNTATSISGDACPPDPLVSKLCSEALCARKPSLSTQWLRAASSQGIDETALLLAAGLSGDANLLDWLVECAAHDPVTVYALDAIRRITGFDALQSVQAERQLIDTVTPDAILAARQNTQQWLQSRKADFRPDGIYFLGKPPTRDHLLQIVQTGYQLDREVAAMRLLNDAKPCAVPVRSSARIQRLAMAQL